MIKIFKHFMELHYFTVDPPKSIKVALHSTWFINRTVAILRFSEMLVSEDYEIEVNELFIKVYA